MCVGKRQDATLMFVTTLMFVMFAEINASLAP